MSARGRERNDVAVLAVGLFLLLLITPLVALSFAVPVAGVALAVGLVASLRWARDERLKPLRVLVIVAAVAAAVLAGWGLLT